jgi:FkbM family methyltransferase
LVGAKGHVYTFEPLPSNATFVKRHLEINKLDNVTLYQMAISNQSGLVQFGAGVSTSTGRIDLTGDLEVQTSSLDDLLQTGRIAAPDVVKIDVEGSEARVLEGGAQTFQHHRPEIFLATHGYEVHQRCLSLLTSLGYSLEPINADNLEEASEIHASTSDAR